MWNKNIKLGLTSVILNWSFLWGGVTATAIFSKYIFGNDNLYEQSVEWVDKVINNRDIDLSPDDSNQLDISKDIEYWQHLN